MYNCLGDVCGALGEVECASNSYKIAYEIQRMELGNLHISLAETLHVDITKISIRHLKVTRRTFIYTERKWS